MRPAIKVGLSTASVYPLRAEAAFEYADRLGYDGVELMVWGESVSQDIDAVRKLSRRYRVPVLSVHAPCLLISQRVWGANPILKLDRSVRAAEQLGAQTVVVHPPFRWQRRYAEGFSDQVAALEAASTVMVAVENMFPSERTGFSGPASPGNGCVSGWWPRSGDLGVRAVLRPAGRQPRALHAGPLAHRDCGHRLAGYGAADGPRADAPAPV